MPLPSLIFPLLLQFANAADNGDGKEAFAKLFFLDVGPTITNRVTATPFFSKHPDQGSWKFQTG